MTVTGTLKTSDSSTLREDFAKDITDLSPVDTPFQEGRSIRRVHNLAYDTMLDHIERETGAITGDVEGGAFPTATAEVRARMGNYVMIKKETVQVSRTQRVVQDGGVTDEYAYQLYRKGQELAIKVDRACWFGEADNGANRVTGGLFQHLFGSGHALNQGTTTAFDVGGHTLSATDVDKYGATMLRHQGAGANLTEAQFQEQLQRAWKRGAKVSAMEMHVPGDVKRKFDDFGQVVAGSSGLGPGGTGQASITRMNMSQSEKTLQRAVAFYQTSFGLVPVILNIAFEKEDGTFTYKDNATNNNTIVVNPQDCAVLFDPHYTDMAILDDYHSIDLAKTDDSTKGGLAIEFGVNCRTPLSYIGIQNWSGAA